MNSHSLAEWLYLLYPRRATEIKLLAYTFLELLFLGVVELYHQEVKQREPVSRHQRRTQVFIRSRKDARPYDYLPHQRVMIEQLWKVQPTSFAYYLGSIEKSLEGIDYREEYVRRPLSKKKVIRHTPQFLASLGVKNAEWNQQVKAFRNYAKGISVEDLHKWEEVVRTLGPLTYILADEQYVGEKVYAALKGHRLSWASVQASQWYKCPSLNGVGEGYRELVFPEVDVPVMLYTFENTKPRLRSKKGAGVGDDYTFVDSYLDDRFYL
ncbi:MAG: hypothetical protein AAFO96_23610 [Bacteroidota bacterium]